MIDMERISIQRHLTVEAISPCLLVDSLAHALWPSRSAHGLRLHSCTCLFSRLRNAGCGLMSKKLTLRRILPDGSCLFRSVACGIINVFCGHCSSTESGRPFNDERTVQELLHNLIAEYLRIYAVVFVSGSDNVRFDTRIGGKYSGYDVLRYLHRFLCQELQGRKFELKRVQKLRSKLAPKLKTLSVRENAPLNGEGLQRKNLIEDETLEEYCRRMAQLETWGGELEILALSNVLQMPIHLHHGNASRRRRRMQVKTYDVPTDASYSLHVVYNGVNHYDALCEAQPGIFNNGQS